MTFDLKIKKYERFYFGLAGPISGLTSRCALCNRETRKMIVTLLILTKLTIFFFLSRGGGILGGGGGGVPNTHPH